MRPKRAADDYGRGQSSPWHSGYCKLISLVGQLGRLTLAFIGELGPMFLFLCSAFAWAFRPPIRVRLIIEPMRKFGVDSLSIIVLSGVFTGMVGGLQGYF